MTKIVFYGLVSSTDPEQFVKLANDAIAKGFQPFGEVQIVKYGGGTLTFQYTQAMVRYEEAAQ